MASVHDVIQRYRPVLELEDELPADEAVEYLVEQTDLDGATIRKTLEALPELLFWHLVRGRPVVIPGVGRIKPAIDLDGTIRAALETDPALVERLSATDAYRAGIDRHENIGASLKRLAQMWNSTHPDDPVRDIDAYAIKA
ncbi:MAG TPA: hypothetical protein VGA52_07990 [Anaerolineales bacterium]